MTSSLQHLTSGLNVLRACQSKIHQPGRDYQQQHARISRRNPNPSLLATLYIMRTAFLHCIPPRENRKFLVAFNYLARQIFASGQQSSKEIEREQTEDGCINETMGQGSVKVRRQLCPERRRGRVTHGAVGKVSRVSRLLGVTCINIIFAGLLIEYCIVHRT